MLSVVIPVRNGADTLAAQLEALVRTRKPTTPIEVVVADNGSTDSTRSIANSFADRLPLTVIDAGRAVGINVARNCGVAATRGETVVLCDADDEVDERWLVNINAAFEAGHQLIAGPIDYRKLNSPEVCAWRGSTKATVATALDFLPAGHGANLAFTRELFDAIDGFDEDFTDGGGCDTDFCWRAELAGFTLHEETAAVVHYRLRPSISALWRQSAGYGRAEVLLYQKHAANGLHRRSLSAPARELWWLISRAAFIVPRGRRGAWVRRCGQSWGRLRGTVSHRAIWW